MKIYGHTLFKNEEKWLWYSVNSVIEHLDKLLLWDTGSTDNSFKIARELKKRYGHKIDLRQYGEVGADTFYQARQKMLDETNADWFLVLDGDEIWWEESIKKVVLSIKDAEREVESIVVPTVNMVGDMYHIQPPNAGNYVFGNHKGHYNLRAVKRDIPGLHSLGEHGVWGWADKDGRQIQNRNTFKFIDAAYMHTTFLPRGESRKDDSKVPKRYRKLKYEIGQELSYNFYYPESFFKVKPDFVPSPWNVASFSYKIISSIQTPFKNIKRRFKNEKVGY